MMRASVVVLTICPNPAPSYTGHTKVGAVERVEKLRPKLNGLPLCNGEVLARLKSTLTDSVRAQCRFRNCRKLDWAQIQATVAQSAESQSIGSNHRSTVR